MSYEGYSQFLCKKGHYWTVDCNLLTYKDKKERCPSCNKEFVFENMVNITNGSFDNDGTRIDGFIDLKVKKVRSGFCSECKKQHICETIYKIPKLTTNGNKN